MKADEFGVELADADVPDVLEELKELESGATRSTSPTPRSSC